ncbi:MAG: hypothetical protein MMC33_004288 [Icmadophila ericetorum]|nr:hypothetical protein [Icmadophila ericetorum]
MNPFPPFESFANLMGTTFQDSFSDLVYHSFLDRPSYPPYPDLLSFPPGLAGFDNVADSPAPNQQGSGLWPPHSFSQARQIVGIPTFGERKTPNMNQNQLRNHFSNPENADFRPDSNNRQTLNDGMRTLMSDPTSHQGQKDGRYVAVPKPKTVDRPAKFAAVQGILPVPMTGARYGPVHEDQPAWYHGTRYSPIPSGQPTFNNKARYGPASGIQATLNRTSRCDQTCYQKAISMSPGAQFCPFHGTPLRVPLGHGARSDSLPYAGPTYQLDTPYASIPILGSRSASPRKISPRKAQLPTPTTSDWSSTESSNPSSPNNPLKRNAPSVLPSAASSSPQISYTFVNENHRTVKEKYRSGNLNAHERRRYDKLDTAADFVPAPNAKRVKNFNNPTKKMIVEPGQEGKLSPEGLKAEGFSSAQIDTEPSEEKVRPVKKRRTKRDSGP